MHTAPTQLLCTFTRFGTYEGEIVSLTEYYTIPDKKQLEREFDFVDVYARTASVGVSVYDIPI